MDRAICSVLRRPLSIVDTAIDITRGNEFKRVLKILVQGVILEGSGKTAA
jgi:hypothetical protein